MKRIFKYATGDAPPEGSVYLATVTQTSVESVHASGAVGYPSTEYRSWIPCWLVWHYFLVDDGAAS